METDLFPILIEFVFLLQKGGWKSTQSTTPVHVPGPHQKLKLCEMDMSSQGLLEQLILNLTF